LALADAFCFGVKGFDFLLGFFLSQNAFFSINSPKPFLLYLIYY
jgi:hypothetical protein